MNYFIYKTPAGQSEVFFHDRITVPAAPPAGAIYVADSNTVPLLKTAAGFSGDVPLVEIPAGENEKKLDTIAVILDKALKAGLARDSLFIGFGGGVITDMTAFAASIYMRGAPVELVPTTLLAMVDASVGGKTGVDFGSFKNSVGSFYPAEKIHISTKLLDTLNEKEFYSGLAEVLKTAMLYNPGLFNLFAEKKDKIISRTPESLLQIVKLCVQAKASVVEKDVYEKGERAFLNLGHTFGHALESTVGFGKISHGEAVAWGIGRAMALGERLGITDPAYRQKVSSILTGYGWEDSPVHSSLSLEGNPAEKLLSAMRGDKKKKNGALRFILQKTINSTLIREVSDNDILAVLR